MRKIFCNGKVRNIILFVGMILCVVSNANANEVQLNYYDNIQNKYVVTSNTSKPSSVSYQSTGVDAKGFADYGNLKVYAYADTSYGQHYVSAMAKAGETLAISGAPSDIWVDYVFHIHATLSSTGASHLWFNVWGLDITPYTHTWYNQMNGEIQTTVVDETVHVQQNCHGGICQYHEYGVLAQVSAVPGEVDSFNSVTVGVSGVFDTDGNELSGVTVCGSQSGWNYNYSSVPEPTTFLLLGLGLTVVAGFRKKFKE